MTQPGNSSETFPCAIGIAGAGAMARMFVCAFATVAVPPRIQLWARNASAAQSVARENGRSKILPLTMLAQAMEIVILATPAIAYREILEWMAPALNPQTIIVSLSNAMAIEEIEDLLPNPVVKVIPTIAHKLKRGVSIIVAGTRADEQAVAKIHCMMRAISTPVIAQDSDCRALSNLAGSGLAIAAEFARLCVSANECALSFGVPGGMTEAAITMLRRDRCIVIEAMMQETFRRQAFLRTRNLHV